MKYRLNSVIAQVPDNLVVVISDTIGWYYYKIFEKKYTTCIH